MILMLRIPLVIGYFLIVAFAGLLLCLLRPFNPDNNYLCARIFSWGGIRLLGLKLRIQGQEHLGKEPCIYVANHQDNLDLFVFGSMLPPRTVTIGKKSLKFIPFFGQLYWLAGNVLIDRGNGQQARKAMQMATQTLTRDNTSVWIFPEGTRNKGNNILPFKKGAFITAIESGMPIVPVCSNSYKKTINLNKFHSGDVTIKILPKIETRGLKPEDIDKLMQTCWDEMSSTITTLDHPQSRTIDMSATMRTAHSSERGFRRTHVKNG
ncbi:1-acyl-sn-glycerol-3-phosphate acyltransferase [Oleiphilus messinensis]|uniref:1-acyl-sn-glycerol-3-phosphate acyltransferase n=1 Tax=Oleiphilus messinensis TaxID=141451 RepID=A0A1Y0IGZ5_9GAMM|nr:lysophospholipid acyltransferase family protein [Oleiphilus messinensis]ARU59409.1 1-acyl-sn-glycerol-3-phosphate acyltransferase [Oleiphilus messinensis]